MMRFHNPIQWQLVTAFVTRLFSTLLLGGCAVMAHGPIQVIPFSSTPSGAEVIVDGESRGFTPLELELARKQSYSVILRLDGQEQQLVISNVPEASTIALDVVPASLAGGASLYLCLSIPPSTSNKSIESLLLCGVSLIATGITSVPISVDAYTGSWFYLSPSEVSVIFPTP
jgi:hypothetical protein